MYSVEFLILGYTCKIIHITAMCRPNQDGSNQAQSTQECAPLTHRPCVSKGHRSPKVHTQVANFTPALTHWLCMAL